MTYHLLAASVLALGWSASVENPQQLTREQVVSFPSGSLTLEGTLTLPDEGTRWPGVVIIAGSGPTDRNGNSVAGISTDMYAMLARGLAERGIASLRYDKRALPSIKGTFDMAASTMSDYAADANSAARFLAARSDIGPVSFIGHSEGGSLALIAARDGAPVAGIVLVSAPGRDATTILREQLGRQLPPPMLAQFDTAWAAYLRGDSAVNVPQGLQALFMPINRRFVQSWNELEPVEILRGLKLPALVVHGATDVQTTVTDAEALRSARPDVELVMLPGVNHVLKLASGATMQAQMSSYTDRTLPLAPDVVPTIARFILQRAK
jgi:pimeloyl-ACP methyl ester carboxylesterase